MGIFRGRVDPINLQRRIFRHQIWTRHPQTTGASRLIYISRLACGAKWQSINTRERGDFSWVCSPALTVKQ